MTTAITFIIAGTPVLAWRLLLYCSQLWTDSIGPGPRSRLIIAGILLALPPGAAQALETPPAVNTHLIESITGPAPYTAYSSVCHGWDGKSTGPMSKFLKVRDPDLTRIAIRNRGVFSRNRIERVISGGERCLSGDPYSRRSPGTGTSVRIANLARYIEEMQKK